MSDNRFECCFEHSHKGIFLDVNIEKQYNYCSFTMNRDIEPEIEVCIRKEEAQRLISILQTFIRD